MTGREESLRDLQAWFQGAVTSALGTPADADVADHVLPSSHASEAERLDVYRDLYWTRMRDCLAEDFPAVRALVGEDRFASACDAFIREHPSRFWSLNRFGDGFAEFLAARGDAPANELARLEWAQREILFGPRDDTVSTDDLLSLPADRLGEVTFEPIRALRLLAFEHDVHAFAAAVREGTHAEAPVRSPTWLLVHRRAQRVRRTRLARDAFLLLESLFGGCSLDDAFARVIGAGADSAELAQHVQAWFRDWTADGVFRSARLADACE